MADDLQLGRPPKVAYRNGAVVALAHTLGLKAPASQRIAALLHQAEAGQQAALSTLSGAALLASITPNQQ